MRELKGTVLSTPRPKVDRRAGILEETPEKPTPIKYEPETSSLRLLMHTKGYSMDMSFVENDPFVAAAMEELWGGIPPELEGYTRSGASLQGLYSSLARYDIQHKGLPKGDPDFAEAVNIARAAFDPGEKVLPKDIDSVTFKPNTSAGWTFLGRKKWEVEDDARREAKKLSRLAKKGKLSKAAMPPAVAFVRTQLAEVENPKVRLVWGIPFEVILWEGQFIEALLETYEGRDIPMPWGQKMLKQLPILIDNLFVKGDGVGIDWSGFDASISPDALRLGYSIIRDFLLLTPEQKTEFEKFVDYAVSTPLVMPNGYVYLKVGGIASGLFSTQLLGSILNFIFMIYLQKKMWRQFFRTHVLGDDSAFSVPKGTDVDFQKLASIAYQKLGLVLNVKKSIHATTPREFYFLGHASEAGKVEREETKLLRLALYPEREVPGPGTSVSRIEGILVDSGFKSGALFNLYVYLVNKYKEYAPFSERGLNVVFGIDLDPQLKPLWEPWIQS